MTIVLELERLGQEICAFKMQSDLAKLPSKALHLFAGSPSVRKCVLQHLQ